MTTGISRSDLSWRAELAARIAVSDLWAGPVDEGSATGALAAIEPTGLQCPS
jgi:hypothetical protein